jgi:hypothetical protein
VSILHHTPQRQRNITVRELDQHGIDRLEGVALLVFPGRVHCCADCAADPDHLASLLKDRPENERVDVLYSDSHYLAVICCTGHQRRHPAQ